MTIGIGSRMTINEIHIKKCKVSDGEGIEKAKRDWKRWKNRYDRDVEDLDIDCWDENDEVVEDGEDYGEFQEWQRSKDR